MCIWFCPWAWQLYHIGNLHLPGIRAFQDSSIKLSNLDCRIEINCKLLAGADVLYCEALATAALQVHTAALTMTTTTTSNIGVVHCSEISITSYQAMRQSQRVKWIYWLLGVQQSVTNVKCIISRHNHFFFSMHIVWWLRSLLIPSTKKVSGNRNDVCTASLPSLYLANHLPCKSSLSGPNVWHSIAATSGLYGVVGVGHVSSAWWLWQ